MRAGTVRRLGLPKCQKRRDASPSVGAESLGAEKPTRRPIRVVFLATLVRGSVALALGSAVIIDPEAARPFLANFIGVYWLVAGILSLRWGIVSEQGRWLPRLVGIVGIVAGLIVVLRLLFTGFFTHATALTLLGAVALVNGLVHATAGFRSGEQWKRKWSVESLLLGTVEITLGTLLILQPAEVLPVITYVVVAWAYAGGAILISDALRMRASSRSRGSEAA